MSRRSEKYQVSINTPATGVIQCGTLIIRENDGNTDGVGFKYSSDYLDHAKAFSIDPVALPLSDKAYQYSVNNNLPGVLDDYLPDAWGRRVITRAATVSQKQDFNSNSIIDILSLVSHSNIGALSIHNENKEAVFDLGVDFKQLTNAESAAQSVDDPGYKIQLEATKLLHLWREGSGAVGGARPKSLIYKDEVGYLAKFNSYKDDFNFAKVELACLLMAQAAGINIKGGFVQSDVNGRDVLLLERFDLLPKSSRMHLLTINSFLKDPFSFTDYGQMFRYDNIHQILKFHSVDIQRDLEQLLLVMLFNRAINNVDDHERNFSLCNDGCGYKLSPAYDLVPSLVQGQYHAAGFQYSNFPPKPSEMTAKQRVLGVAKNKVKSCAEQVIEVVKQWPQFAESAGVSEEDKDKINSVINL